MELNVVVIESLFCALKSYINFQSIELDFSSIFRLAGLTIADERNKEFLIVRNFAEKAKREVATTKCELKFQRETKK